MLDSIPSPVREAVASQLQPMKLIHFSPVSGGCINHGGKITTSGGDYFIKWNDCNVFPLMFEKEAKGLRLLRTTQSIRVNEVVGFGESGDHQFIILEWINGAPKAENFWSLLGQRLASLHGNTSTSFGLDHDNYIGSLRQYNPPSVSWTEFFIHQRLEPQIRLATDNHRPVQTLRKKIEAFYKVLPGLLPEEPPALLHGDLWGGNLLADEKGNPTLIDPAVYFGHREADLAYTHLFGHFDPVFYQAYEETTPLTPGFLQRVDIYNLYPLLVHVNLFGGGYVMEAEAVLNRFG
jgi:protein-ribulosamine 3-kinase